MAVTECGCERLQLVHELTINLVKTAALIHGRECIDPNRLVLTYFRRFSYFVTLFTGLMNIGRLFTFTTDSRKTVLLVLVALVVIICHIML